ncbi:MAG TPA: hypothetical protein ENK05_11610 [Gammaproteobacteria bacterium]|nr:hypothetical protein [Gammaproteobacteria bacterium]
MTDARLHELREIGLPRWLIDLACEIGVDAALAVWRRLSDAARERGDNRVHVPAWSTYLRYQRNRFIHTLAAQGHPPSAIRDKVRAVLCEEISIAHIKRIVKGATLRASAAER